MNTHCQHAAERLFLGGVIAWLAVSALTVDIEYYDGYSAIANARYFLGLTDGYVSDRGPLMGLLLMPAEAFRALAGLHPLDLRPHHATSAVIHIAFLVTVYAILVRVFGRSWAVLASFVACVPSFMFFSYAPFLSHDLYPGLLLLAMLFRREKFVEHPSVLGWIDLVVLGAAAALVKQTFGVFWILVLGVSFFHTLRSTGGERAKTLWALVGGAIASGIITWLILGLILGNTDPNTPLLIRPFRNLQYLAAVYEGTQVEFPLWIYLRNFPAYGWLMCLLILPGWVLSLRGTRFQQSLAVAWLGGLIFLHVLPLREVRYMAFLAPLSAGLLIPAIERLAGRRLLLAVAGLVFAIDLGRCSVEAAQILDPFYHSGIQQRFFESLNDPRTRKGPVFINSFMLSFVAPDSSPLAADRYHRIFHFGTVHLQRIFGCSDVRVITDARSARDAALAGVDGAPLFFATDVLARGPTWRTGPPQRGEDFFQCVAVLRSQNVKITHAADGPDSPANGVSLIEPSQESQEAYIIEGPPCTLSGLGELFPVLMVESRNRAYSLKRIRPNAYAILGMDDGPEFTTSRLCRFEIQQFSTLGSGR